jgi:hypothetical protein
VELPERLEAGAFHDLPAGTELHRLHSRDFGACAFNPCRGEPTRFAPIADGAGACVPSIYAATTFDGAAYETVFRGTPSRYAAVPRQRLNDRAASVIRPVRSLRLVGLFTPELKGWGLEPEQVLKADEASHDFCRALAARIWRDNPRADGLIWASVRDSAARAMVFFGGRVAAGDLAEIGTRLAAEDESVVEDLVRAGRRAGWKVSR